MNENTSWWDALGKPVDPANSGATLDLLVSQGFDQVETLFVLGVVAREIRHDNPDRAFRVMRGLIGSDETLVIRALATMIAPIV